jgi:hypothetical protein
MAEMEMIAGMIQGMIAKKNPCHAFVIKDSQGLNMRRLASTVPETGL